MKYLSDFFQTLPQCLVYILNHCVGINTTSLHFFTWTPPSPPTRFPVSRCARIKAKRVSVCNKRKLSSRHSVLVSSGVRLRVPPAGRAVCDMANKENELTCPEKVQAIHYNDNCMFPVNSAAEAGSKMAGPGNKYSDYFTEVRDYQPAPIHSLPHPIGPPIL